MAKSYGNQVNQGAMVPTTNVWDVNELYTTEVGTPEFTELLVRLYQNINNIAINLNLKDTGYYSNNEFLNGQLYFPSPNNNSKTDGTPSYRQVFRTVVNFGALPNNDTKSVQHNISVNSNYTFTRIYGAASSTASLSYLPLPYSSGTLNKNIGVAVDANYVSITTSVDWSSYNITYVVLEYIKQ